MIETVDGYRPSSEMRKHFRCYEEREDVGAVLHAHPPVATGFVVADIPLDEYSMIETVPVSYTHLFLVFQHQRYALIYI